MSKKRLATTWMDGCSGCHMSFLDLDEQLFDLAALVDVVYSPIADIKEFPADVDITLVEGAVGNEEDREKIQIIRKNTKTLIALGDCAVTANVSGMRNTFGVPAILQHVYHQGEESGWKIPHQQVPTLRPQARPIHEWVDVDLFLPGCPPSAKTIFYVLSELLEGRQPDPNLYTRFGM